MARKQLGMVDDGLIAAIDADAERRGETRRSWIERTSRAALGSEREAGSDAVSRPAISRQTPPRESYAAMMLAKQAKLNKGRG